MNIYNIRQFHEYAKKILQISCPADILKIYVTSEKKYICGSLKNCKSRL